MVKFDASQSSDQGIAKLILTSRDLYSIRKTISALKKTVPGACIRSTGFRAVFSLDPELKKEDLKVRLLKGGILQIEWPRETQEGEEIKVE